MASSMDWNELADSNLPTLGTGSDATWPLRDFSQLQGAGQSLLRRSGESGSSILSRPFNELPTTKTDGIFPSSHRIRPMESLEDVIAHHEQEIMAHHIQRFTDETRQNTKEAVERQLQAAWEEDQAVWLHQLVGHRFVGGNAASSALSPVRPSGPSSLTAQASRSQSFQPYTSHSLTASVSTKFDPAFVQAHWKVIKDFMGPERRAQASDCVDQFSTLVTSVSPSPGHRSDMQGYSSAWSLAAHLVRVPNTPAQQAKATLAHVCKQFQAFVWDRVRNGAPPSTSVYHNPLTQACETFARLSVGFADPLVVVYYCLRCGDAVATQEALQQASADQAVHRIVHGMAQAQGNAACVWEGSDSWLVRMNAADRKAVADLLESAKRLDEGVASKLHQVGVYSLLSGSNSQAVSTDKVEGFKTIEDYLMQLLWKAMLQPNVVDELIAVSKLVLDFGPTYFDNPSTGGWSYATPLLLSQQYQKALQWLAESGNLLHAAHLGLVFSYAGMPVRNLGESDSVVGDTVASLLVAYSKELLKEHGVLCALDYLLHIPNINRVQKEIAQLIVTTRDYTTLVGTLDNEGARRGGAIAEHFTLDQLALIVKEAANLLTVHKEDRQALITAVMCLLLGERYGDALSLMNELLSPANKPDDNRGFWIEEASKFVEFYLTKRTRISEAMGRENQSSLILTCRRLLDLNALFSRIEKGLIDNTCRQLVFQVHLLPESDDDRLVKEMEYRDLDPLIKAMYPFLLVAAMKVMIHDHNRLKQETRLGGPESVRLEMQEIRKKARMYTSFASSITVGTEQIEAITQMETLLI